MRSSRGVGCGLEEDGDETSSGDGLVARVRR
jgi:hypothetical protein